MQDDMMDMMEMTNEINETLGRSYAVPDDVDESDLMDELDALELELGEEETEGGEAEPSYLQEPDLPSAPTGEYAQEEGQAEDQQQNEPLAVNQSNKNLSLGKKKLR